MSSGHYVGEKRLPALLYIFHTFRALTHGGEDEIRGAFLQPPPEVEGFPVYRAQILSNLAAYHYGVQDIPSALEAVKEAMLLSQHRKEGRGLTQAYRLFSLVNIFKQRIGDAIDYFSFAIENAESSGHYDELAITAYYAAGTHFLFGNISRADRLARQADQAASQSGRPEWADRARFFQGRFRFEIGHYQEALDIFEGLIRQDIPAAPAEREATLSAWIFRTKTFIGDKHPLHPKAAGIDARLFEIEAAYLTGNYEATVELADALYNALPQDQFLYIEQPDWRSGFSQCELLLFTPRHFFTRLLSTYKALALGMISHHDDSTRERALESIRRVVRDEAMPQTDPNDAFYYYSQYCVLRETGAMEVDRNTAVSMAFKRLQSRASRIDDIETKRAYLALNHWNGALGLAAKEHKLI
jgi:tetratricopeptide (TPR) repeat protein